MKWNPLRWFRGGESHLDKFRRNNPIIVGAATKAGVKVTIETALQLSAMHRAVQVLANGVAQVDLITYRETKDGEDLIRKPAIDHPAYKILRDRVNPWLTSYDWRQLFMWQVILGSVSYSILNRVRGRLDSIIPCVPGRVEKIVQSPGVYHFMYDLGDGRKLRLEKEEVLEIQGVSWEGTEALDAIKIASESLGLTAAINNSHANFQRTEMRPAGILTLDSEHGLDEDARKRVKANWDGSFGTDGNGGVAVLEKKWNFVPLSMSATDAQLIENRNFQVSEIARHIGVQPQMLFQDNKNPTHASAEEFFKAHVTYDLRPWYIKLEQLINLWLLPEDDLFAKFDYSPLIAGTLKDQGEYYAKALGAGGHQPFMTVNEVRAKNGLNPINENHARTLGRGVMEASQDDSTNNAQV
jgi:HK97 family phage portal protein